MTMPTWLAVILMTCSTVAANLLLKTGTAQGVTFIEKLFNLTTVLGFACYGLAAIVYVYILSKLPLGIAQSFAAAQYMAVILASVVVLREVISWQQWSGILLITAGIAVLGLTR